MVLEIQIRSTGQVTPQKALLLRVLLTFKTFQALEHSICGKSNQKCGYDFLYDFIQLNRYK